MEHACTDRQCTIRTYVGHGGHCPLCTHPSDSAEPHPPWVWETLHQGAADGVKIEWTGWVPIDMIPDNTPYIRIQQRRVIK